MTQLHRDGMRGSIERVPDLDHGICGIENMSILKMTHPQLELLEHKNEQSKLTKIILDPTPVLNTFKFILLASTHHAHNIVSRHIAYR